MNGFQIVLIKGHGGRSGPHTPCSAVFPVLTSIGRQGTAKLACDYNLCRQTDSNGFYASAHGTFCRRAASPWAQAKALAQAHWKL